MISISLVFDYIIEMAGGDDDGRKITVHVCGAKELNFYIRVKVDTTVANFKSIVAEHCEIPPHLHLSSTEAKK